MKLRIFSLIILGCLVLLMVKAGGLADRVKFAMESLFFPPLSAEEKKEEVKKEEPKEGEVKTEVKEGEKKEGEAKPAEESKEGGEQKISEFSNTEIEILQQLAKRREKLKDWESDMEARERVLSLTQARIDQKISELRDLKGEVEKLLNEYNQKEDKKIQSLVKIYENMKPKNAAAVFSEIDKKTLLQIISKMKEAKVAAILGQMDPKAARDITAEYAQYRKLPAKELENSLQ